jgi:hypothetical protein
VLRVVRALVLVVGTLAIYGAQFYAAYHLLVNPADTSVVTAICGLLLAVYGISLVRAWELLGARRTSLLGWLSSLRGLDEVDEPPSARPTATRAEY